jgi:hypothetical protein
MLVLYTYNMLHTVNLKNELVPNTYTWFTPALDARNVNVTFTPVIFIANVNAFPMHTVP